MEKLEQLANDLSSLTVPQLVQLTKTLEERWGVKALPVVQGPVVQQTTEAPKVEQTEFAVFLTGFPAEKKISVIKTVRETTGLGLAESKTLVESAVTGPKEVKTGLAKADAEELKRKLTEAGATVELK